MRAWLLAIALALGACDVDLERMLEQGRYDPYEPGPFPDGKVMRLPPAGTVSRSAELAPPAEADGIEGGMPIDRVPIPVTDQVMQRGRNRYDIFCAPCHGVLGDADTPVADVMSQRPPPSLHEPRIRDYPAGRIYRVISLGYGLMPSYGAELHIRDRWAVVAYVQALQLSQYALLDALPDDLGREARAWLTTR